MGVSFQLYARRWRPHLAAAALAQLPALVPTLVLISLLLDATVALLLTRTIEALAPAAVLSLLLLVITFFSAFLFVLMGGAACQLVACWLDYRDVSLIDAYALALRRFWRLAGAVLAAFGIVFGGLLALGAFLAIFQVGFLVVFQVEVANDPWLSWVMLAIIGIAAFAACVVLLDMLVRWSVFVQAVIVEGRGPVGALARSAELVRGNWWRVAGAMGLLIAVPLVLMIVLASVLTVAFMPLAFLGVASAHLTNGAAIAIAQVTLSPVPAIGVTVLYYRLRDGRAIWDRIEARARADPLASVAERR